MSVGGIPVSNDEPVEPLLFSNYFYDAFILYQNLNNLNDVDNKGFVHFSNDEFSGSVAMTINTEGVSIQDADLYSKSELVDKPFILNGTMNVMFHLNYQSWLETVISFQKNSYMGSKDDNASYRQGMQSNLLTSTPEFYFNLLYVKFNLVNSDRFNVSLSFGEQMISDFYRIQNVFQNYVYPDMIDGLLLRVKNNDIGKFDFLLIDIFNLYENWTQQPHKYNSIPVNQSDIIGNYNGDVLSFRSGIFYETPNLLKTQNPGRWNVYVNTMFTRYGPVVSGVDRSNKSGNFVDNDYLLHYGIGTFFQLGGFSIFLELWRSDGIDRKLPDIMGNLQDILINGYFFRTGIFWQLPLVKSFSHALHLNLVYSDGPAFDKYGNKKSYGFVASGNHDSGGFLLNNIWGFRPYALSINSGVVNNLSYGYYHCSGAIILNAGYTIFIANAGGVDLQSRFIFDTSMYENTKSIFTKTETFSGFNNRYVGNENMLSFFYSINSVLQLFVSFDVFVPGELYRYFNHGIYNEKTDPFYGILAGMRILF